MQHQAQGSFIIKHTARIIAASFLALSPATGFAALETYPESITNAEAHAGAPAAWMPAAASIVKVAEAGSVGANPYGLKFYGTPANNQLIVRSVSNANAYNGAWGSVVTAGTNYTIFDTKNRMSSWVTTGNSATSFIDTNGLTAGTVVKGLEKGLGMNDTGAHTAIFEMAVTVSNTANPYLLRPTRIPDPTGFSTDSTKYGTGAGYPANATDAGIGSGPAADNTFNSYKDAYDYKLSVTYTTDKFPYTQLGYTYYWGQADNVPPLDKIQGMSEFILLGGTGGSNPALTPSGTDESGNVIVVGIYSPQSYVYTKNDGTALSNAAGSQYGNGFASFNVTGACDTLWAGAAFQAGTSLDAAMPNTITVEALGDISGGEGILVDSQNYTVTNAGTITANAGAKKFNIAGTENIAILFKGASYTYSGAVKNVLNNSGNITGPAAGTAVKVLAGNTDLTNTGTITGPACGIWLLSGANTIANSGTITGGTNAIRLGGGTTAITNTGTINGNVTMDAGSGATLDVGTNNLALSGGGTYTQGAGTTLKLTANSPTEYGKVTAVGAAIDPASSVNVTVGDYIPNNTSFKIVDTSGAGIGKTPGAIMSNSQVLAFSGSGSSGDLIITATRAHPYNTLASTANAGAVGMTLEEIGAKATGDMLTVLNTLDIMTSATQVSSSLESMHPDMSSGAAQGARAIANQFFSSVSSRIGYARSGLTEMGISTGDMFHGTGVWFQGLGSHAKQGTRKGIAGYQYNTFGTTFGGDKIFGDHVRLGLAGGYGYADVNGKTMGRPRDSINSFQGILYGSYDSLSLGAARKEGKYSEEAVRTQGQNLWYVDGMFGFTQNNYDSRREIYLGDMTRVANATHYAQQYATMLETGYTFVFKKTKALQITPFASLTHSYLYMNRYSENGAEALNLTVDGKGYNELEQGLGLKLAYPLLSKKYGTFIPTVRGAWLYDYMGERYETTSSFTWGGPSFVTTGARPAQDGALLGASIIFLNRGNLTLTGNYDWELRDEFASHTYYGTVRADF